MYQYCRTIVIRAFLFARWMILGRLECQLYSCAHVSNLSSIGPPNSTTRKGTDNHHGEDAMFDVFTATEAIRCANQKLPAECYSCCGHFQMETKDRWLRSEDVTSVANAYASVWHKNLLHWQHALSQGALAFKGTNGRQKTYEVFHVHCIFYSGFMSQTTVTLGIRKMEALNQII